MECDSPGECRPESDRRLDDLCGSHLQSQIEGPFDFDDDYRTGYEKVGHT